MWVLVLFAVGCMPKVEKEEDIGSPEILTHSIERSLGSAKIRLEGRVPAGSWIMKVVAESGGWDVEQNSMGNFVASSGVPVAQWAADSFILDYPVPNPSVARKIVFKIKVKMPDGRISLYPAEREVDYFLPVESIPGYAVTSGGTFEEVAGYRLMGSAGMIGHHEAGGGNTSITTPGTGAFTLRSGLHGILYDDTL